MSKGLTLEIFSAMAGANEFQKQMMKEQKEASDALAEVEKLKKKMVDFEDKAKVFACVCFFVCPCYVRVCVCVCIFVKCKSGSDKYTERVS